MKKRIIFSLLALLIIAAWILLRSPPFPPLKDGDLIFQTSHSNQSTAILVATASPYTHVGIIKRQGNTFVVIEAGGQVRETPLDKWAHRGWFHRVAIYRDPLLSDVQVGTILSAAQALYGKPYDRFFLFGDAAIYCSELPYLAYKAANVPIGKIQTIGELDMDNKLVQRLIRRRWNLHPECQKHHDNFDQCYHRILAQPLITPASIAADGKFTRIYSNYPFGLD